MLHLVGLVAHTSCRARERGGAQEKCRARLPVLGGAARLYNEPRAQLGQLRVHAVRRAVDDETVIGRYSRYKSGKEKKFIKKFLCV